MNVGDVERERVLQASLTWTRSAITRTQNKLNEYDDRPDDAMMPWEAQKRDNLRASIEEMLEEEKDCERIIDNMRWRPTSDMPI